MTRTPSILFYADFSESFVPSDLERRPLGGSETALTHLARGLASLGHEVIVASHPGPRAGTYEDVLYGNIAERPWARKQIDAAVIFRQITHVRRSLPGSIRILWAHDHIGIFPELPQGMRRSLLKTAWSMGYRLFGGQAPFVVTVSEWLRRCFVSFAGWPNEQAWAISNAVNPALFAAAPGRSSPAPRVVYTSVPERGLELLIGRIMPAVWRRLADVELHVFSYRPLDQYSALASEYQDRVRFRGGLSHADLARELSYFDLWLYPTDFPETSCIAAMEAQAAGVPAVTSRRFALQETVLDGETGVLIEGVVGSPEYVDRFSGAVVTLLRDRERRLRMGARARERILTDLTWDRVAKQWSDLLHMLSTA